MATFRTSDSVTLFFRDRGRGPALIFLHGLAAAGAVFEHQALHFADRYRVITPDLRGCGLSDHPDFGNRISRNARDVLQLMDHLALEHAILVGSSAAGNIALRCALDAPVRITGIVTVGAPFGMVEGQPDHPAIVGFLAGQRINRAGLLLDFAARQFAPEADPGLKTWLGTLALTSGPFVGGLLLDLAHEALSDRLCEINAPVAILQGALDPAVPLDVGRAALARLPHAEEMLFERCAHLPFIEDPPAFSACVERFLEKFQLS